ncbi:HNH endonuclease [Nitratireductor luteus]|uniref:HNH endonuclease n=1 Tax=Nitratireductor luteus TaxID=2976980 RepID=UPI00223ECB15|nr:HNH endonuclease signature motif containing protein [Nitratireductor luteus]
MVAKLFDKSDDDYFAWIEANPESFIANTRRNISPSYFVIHLPSCKHITVRGDLPAGAFTERDYVKVAALDLAALVGFASYHQVQLDKITYCESCKPDRTNDLDLLVKKSLRDPEERRRKLAESNGQARFRTVLRREFIRSEHVIAERLEIAGHHCESCGKEAPFLRNSNGLAYLEVHHKKPLSEGGLDTVENTIALCPNCHRREHHGVPKHPA